MSGLDVYVFLLCLIVFSLLTGIFTWFTIYFIKTGIRLIRLGAEDENIKTEYLKTKRATKRSKALSIFDKVFSLIVCILVITFFGVSACVNVESNKTVGDVPVIQVVKSASMQSRYEGNEYLFKNNLTDQIKTFDLITVYKLPAEDEIELYDIVVYEVDDMLVVHRIVGIEEPNEKHPNQRYFLLQGDAVHVPDKFPVTYNQMKGIYRGERLAYVGSFVIFMQSPAGFLCVLLVLFVMIAVPVVEKKLLKVKLQRLIEIGFITADGEIVSEPLSELNVETIKEVLEEKQIAIDSQTALTSASPQIYFFEEEQTPNYVEGLVEEPFVIKEWYETAGKGKTFREKHDTAPKELIRRYNEIVKNLYRIKDLDVWEGKAFETYKKGRTPIARLVFRGKSLYAYLALNPKDFENTKYLFSDVSSIKTFKDYPMRVKVSSSRQARWVNELVNLIAVKNGLYQYAMTTLFTIKGSDKTFEQKLKELPEKMLARYNFIKESLSTIVGLKEKTTKKHVTYKQGIKPVAKLKIIGKTLNVYINLSPKKFKNTKYVFIDVSNKKSHENYPMRVKVSSDRQAKWVIELIKKV